MIRRYLMDFCFKYQQNSCPVDQIKNARQPKETKEEEVPAIFPYGQEQEKLDRICEKCEHGLFEIDKFECPVCKSRAIASATIGKISLEPVKSSWTIYRYHCLGCKSLLFSYKKLGSSPD